LIIKIEREGRQWKTKTGRKEKVIMAYKKEHILGSNMRVSTERTYLVDITDEH
jgi:hypothetical protein